MARSEKSCLMTGVQEVRRHLKSDEGASRQNFDVASHSMVLAGWFHAVRCGSREESGVHLRASGVSVQVAAVSFRCPSWSVMTSSMFPPENLQYFSIDADDRMAGRSAHPA
ncbi:uncharacterized protein [Dermacentor albipictus]|uniref:uncharacterized protein n=1 Tax=Dermacentor albipictus TaxID=60249 RepID=UPI0031FCC71E